MFIYSFVSFAAIKRGNSSRCPPYAFSKTHPLYSQESPLDQEGDVQNDASVTDDTATDDIDDLMNQLDLAVADVQTETEAFKALLGHGVSEDDSSPTMPATNFPLDETINGFQMSNIGMGILPKQPGFIPSWYPYFDILIYNSMVEMKNAILAFAYNSFLPMLVVATKQSQIMIWTPGRKMRVSQISTEHPITHLHIAQIDKQTFIFLATAGGQLKYSSESKSAFSPIKLFSSPHHAASVSLYQINTTVLFATENQVLVFDLASSGFKMRDLASPYVSFSQSTY